MRAILLSAALVLAAPAAAQASGGGLSATYGGQGVTSPGNPNRYVVLPSHGNAVVQELRDGGVFRWKSLRGRFGVPQVALDGSKTGLSADGRTLVLADVPRTYPVRRTRLLVLRAASFSVLQRIALKDWYSVDAVSPDGRTVYLVHYLRDPGAYEVIAYDRASGRRTVIMDPDEPDEEMAGQPMSRVTSPDGRYAYTLYDGPEEPFVHALDTEGRSAECIDLPQLKGTDLSRAALRLDGHQLRIGTLTIDARTQRPVRPSAPVLKHRGGGMSPWPMLAALGALGALVLVVVRRRSAPEVVDLDVSAQVADPEREAGAATINP